VHFTGVGFTIFCENFEGGAEGFVRVNRDILAGDFGLFIWI
jgi:hypothetical protein